MRSDPVWAQSFNITDNSDAFDWQGFLDGSQFHRQRRQRSRRKRQRSRLRPRKRRDCSANSRRPGDAGSPLILAIDQGTTSTRAVMFDAAGAAPGDSANPLPQIYPADGWVEHDPEAIWQATVSVCRDVIAKTGGVEGVAAIGITNQRETTVVWDRVTGKPVMNAIVWQDRRGADDVRAACVPAAASR